MIDKFKSYISKRSGAPKILGTNIEDFKRESKDLLSNLLDSEPLLLNIETYGFHYKIILYVNDVNENCDTIKFSKIKNDFIQYVRYMSRKYPIDQEFSVTICDEDFNFKSKTYSLKEIDDIDENLDIRDISFYMRK